MELPKNYSGNSDRNSTNIGSSSFFQAGFGSSLPRCSIRRKNLRHTFFWLFVCQITRPRQGTRWLPVLALSEQTIWSTLKASCNLTREISSIWREGRIVVLRQDLWTEFDALMMHDLSELQSHHTKTGDLVVHDCRSSCWQGMEVQRQSLAITRYFWPWRWYDHCSCFVSTRIKRQKAEHTTMNQARMNQSATANNAGINFNPIKARKYSDIDSSKQAISNKRLRFSDMSTLILTEPKTRQELKASWYSRRDVADFKQQTRTSSQALRDTRIAKVLKHIAYSIASGSPQAPINIHGKEIIRGEEHLISPEVLKLLFQRRRLTVARVLEEQTVQRRLGEVDIHRISCVSRENSAFTKEWSLRITRLQSDWDEYV